ncbi:MAG: hypothetical protein V4555_16920 [Acidobacteriota bacterium]
MVALLGRLEDMQRNPETAREIQDFDAFVAVLARRACSAWSRRQHPSFHRLRAGLRYLLLADKRFALWQNAQQEWVCGWARWKSGSIEARLLDTDVAATVPSDGPQAAVLGRIFERVGHPLFFNELAKFCASFWAVDDRPQPIESAEVLAGPDGEMEASVDRAARLKLVWDQIRELPLRQRVALLLNMHGPDGECGTSLLVLTGTASPREVASVLDMPAEEFAELWLRLPLSDLEIAERLKISRQQVINLRKCARERLRRRTRSDSSQGSNLGHDSATKKVE